MNNETKTNLTAALAFETGLDVPTAEKVVQWFETEATLDYPIVEEIYGEGIIGG